MRTTQDLEAAFADLADTAPDAQSLTVPDERTPGRQHGRARRVLVPLAAAIATVAVVGGILYAVDDPGQKSAPPAAGSAVLQPPRAPSGEYDSPDLTFRFTADAPDGSSSAPSYAIDRGGQVLNFGGASVTLFYRDPADDPDEAPFTIDKVAHRKSQDVAGHPGFYGRLGGHYTDKSEKLYWEYAPGAWAQASGPDRKAQLALAESVRPATTGLRVPVDPTPIVGGQYVNIIDSSSRGGSFEIGTSGDGYGGYLLGWGNEADEVGQGGSAARPENVTINGRSWTITGDAEPIAVLNDRDTEMTVNSNYGTTRAELVKLLGSLHFAPDVSDRGTWFDASELLD